VWAKVVFYCVSLMGLLQLVLSRPLGRFLLFNHVIFSSVCLFVSICYSEMALMSLDYFIFILQYWFQDKDHWAWWQANQIANMGYSRSRAVPNYHNWLVYIDSSFRHITRSLECFNASSVVIFHVQILLYLCEKFILNYGCLPFYLFFYSFELETK
jgi:hypothetical protein